jgi:hypothetical protein
MAHDQQHCSNDGAMVPLEGQSTIDPQAQEALVRMMRHSSGVSWVKIVGGFVAGLTNEKPKARIFTVCSPRNTTAFLIVLT